MSGLTHSVWSRSRRLVNVTAHPTAEWVVRQITEAFPWNEAPRYMIRDLDCIDVGFRRQGRPSGRLGADTPGRETADGGAGESAVAAPIRYAKGFETRRRPHRAGAQSRR